jgi:hypothetical protein
MKHTVLRYALNGLLHVFVIFDLERMIREREKLSERNGLYSFRAGGLGGTRRRKEIIVAF